MKQVGEYDESELFRLSRVGRWLCMCGAAIGAMGLLGHLVGAAFLTTLVPGLPSMTRVTALALVLVGGAGAVPAGTPSRAGLRVIPLLLAFIVLIVGLATLAEHGLGIEVPIDKVLAPGPTTSFRLIPAPLTALALTCLAIALLLRDGNSTARIRFRESLVLCAALMAYTGLAGILLGAAPLYRLSRAPAIGLSLPTSIGLLTICAGVLLQHLGTGLMGMATSSGPGGVLVRRLFVPTLVAPMVAGLIVERTLAAMQTDDPSLAIAIVGAAMAVLTLFMLFLAAGSLNRAEREQRFLAGVWPALTTLDDEDIQSRIADMAVRGLADLSIVDLVDQQDGERRTRIAFREPAHVSIRDALHVMVFDSEKPPWRTMASTPISVPQPYPAAWAGIDHRIQALGNFALQSVIVAPLVAHERLLGSLSLLSVTPGKVYGPHDLRLAGEIARRTALAVENAQLFRAAQRAIQIRDDVLGIVAHDLRTPLSVILANSRLVQQRVASGSPGEAEGLADGICRSAMHMNRLIQDLLDVTRFEARQLDLAHRRISVRDVLNEIFNLQGELASSASLQLRLELPEQVPDVWADSDRLLQVLENLVGNAVKFTPAGGDIAVGATAWNTDVIFWVRDTGCGIALDDQPHVFDRFWQARTTKRAGSGLGLAIVKSIVETHGGHVWVESTPGRGSTFFFSIPAVTGDTHGTSSTAAAPLPAQADRMNTEHEAVTDAPTPVQDLSGEVCDDRDRGVSTPPHRPRVILADDDEGILSAFRRLLSPSCDVLAAVTNGADLVAAAAKLQPDAIVMDKFMGTSLADRCRALQRVVPWAKVVIVTAADVARVEREAVREGAAAVVSTARAADDLELTPIRNN